MIPTIRTLLDRPALGLRLRAGTAGLDHEVRWVAVSELEDPTPYLDGSELVLTTGLRLEPANAADYIERLAGSGVAGLGLGVGLTHPSVPSAWVEAADRVGLPLVEVPEPTPFIAISKTVSEYLAAAEYEAVTRTVEAQRDLTRAALAPDGAAAVVAKLAATLSGRALLLDSGGSLMHAAPRSAVATALPVGFGSGAPARARTSKRRCIYPRRRCPASRRDAASCASRSGARVLGRDDARRSLRPRIWPWSTSAPPWCRWPWSAQSAPTPHAVNSAPRCSPSLSTESRSRNFPLPEWDGVSCSPDPFES